MEEQNVKFKTDYGSSTLNIPINSISFPTDKMFPQLWQLCAVAASFIWLCIGIYKALFSPLSKIPGPKDNLFSDTYLMVQEFTSKRREYIHELHKRYGPVVRLGPNEVSFTSLEALKEIYSSGGSGYDKTEFYTLFKQFGTR
jgi:hypothetical protein